MGKPSAIRLSLLELYGYGGRHILDLRDQLQDEQRIAIQNGDEATAKDLGERLNEISLYLENERKTRQGNKERS